ncbi:torsin-1A-interacting protein 2 [Toxotes jaculatrix]|uniref:torsin-1A-interacting protein 2 n=1 Tax=Toxotes jaculatrix TaxID=941984 RepID=UPI001B3ADD6E|nr:torsin-1A-interacting protein 2 [Toxotes jaculatrix]
MAEQVITHQDTADNREDKTQSTNMDHVSPCDEDEPEKTNIAPNVMQQHSEDSASSSASTNREAENDSGEAPEQADVKNSGNGSAEENIVLLIKGPQHEESSGPSQDDDGSHGDCRRDTPKKADLTTKAEISKEDLIVDKKAPETTVSLTLSDTEDDAANGPKDGLNEESSGAGSGDGRAPECALPPEDRDIQDNTTSLKTALPEEGSEEKETDEQRNNVENIGPATQETTEPTVPEVTGVLGGSVRYLIAAGIVVVVAILVNHLLQPESRPQENNVDIFFSRMEAVKAQFPNQRAELWNRSRIHLQRHLQTDQPTAPVSLILTAGLRAKKTLHCLAHGLASAFSSALNASVLHIDGASTASQDSDQVKLDIDSKLQGAFEGDKPVAIIHRFEELPPGSTLIFYRYCDHENAAYKKTFLIFTVLLEDEEEIPAKINLNAVEEMVDDHLQKKFLSHGRPVSFDKMDLDKYGGLWSRISHLILPVALEERIEHKGC